MKKLFALILASMMMVALIACSEEIPTQSVKETLPLSTEESITEEKKTLEIIKAPYEPMTEVSSDEDINETPPTTTTTQPTTTTIKPTVTTKTPTATTQAPTATTKAPTTTTKKPTITTKPSHTHSYSNATCTEPAKCSCGTTNGSALGHSAVKDPAVTATCTSTGLTEGSHCSRCKTIIAKQNKVEKVAHKEVVDKAIAATCTKSGLTEGKHCLVCNTVIVGRNTIPATGHTKMTDASVKPTCTTDGLTEGSHCSVCNVVLVKQETIKATHKYVKAVKNQSTLIATCTVCSNSYEERILELTVTIAHTGTSSATTNGYGSFSKLYKATATGGYGTLKYKFEVYTSATASSPNSSLTIEFSENNTYGISYRGYENAIKGYIIKVTVKDAVGNQATYEYTV